MDWSFTAVAGLIGYTGVLLVSAWFLIFGRRARLSARREPFRKPAITRAWGLLSIAVTALTSQLLVRLPAAPSRALQQAQTWVMALDLVLFGVGVFLLVKAARASARAADAHPAGKHAAPRVETRARRRLIS